MGSIKLSFQSLNVWATSCEDILRPEGAAEIFRVVLLYIRTLEELKRVRAVL